MNIRKVKDRCDGHLVLPYRIECVSILSCPGRIMCGYSRDMAGKSVDLNISCVRSDENEPWTPRDCTVTKTKQLSQGKASKGFFGLFGSRGSTPAAASAEDEEEDLTSASGSNPLAASTSSSSIGSGTGTAITPAQRAMTAPPTPSKVSYSSTGSSAAANITKKRGLLGQAKNYFRGKCSHFPTFLSGNDETDGSL